MSVYVVKLADGQTATGVGTVRSEVPGFFANVQVVVTGTGVLAATVAVEVSNNGVDWLTGVEINATDTTRASAGSPVSTPWLYARSNVTALTGTGAAVFVYMSTV